MRSGFGASSARREGGSQYWDYSTAVGQVHRSSWICRGSFDRNVTALPQGNIGHSFVNKVLTLCMHTTLPTGGDPRAAKTTPVTRDVNETEHAAHPRRQPPRKVMKFRSGIKTTMFSTRVREPGAADCAPIRCMECTLVAMGGES